MKTKSCVACNKNLLEKDTIALNKKLLGREIDKFFCMNCLADYLSVTPEELMDKIDEFKAQGCILFK